MTKRIIVTGGGGFIGAYLVKKLVKDGYQVGVVDNLIRGDLSRFAEVSDEVRLFSCDVRDESALIKAFSGVDVVFHLAAINGTENFYKHPELVLDIGVLGTLAVVNACKKAKVFDLVIASSAEVYQTPKVLPTPEDTPLLLPNSINARYSYGGSKIISELIAFNYGKDHFQKIQVFRPHNIYGANMGYKHVIPQFLIRAIEAQKQHKTTTIPFRIQGDGTETRAFCYIDDAIDGIMIMYNKGTHREIYHIGNNEEVSILQLADTIANVLKTKFNIIKSPATLGGTPRRCPDISKMRSLGYKPKINLASGIKKTAKWYLKHNDKPKTGLM